MLAQQTNQATIQPSAGETEDRFVIRVHRLLLDRVPEPDERNQLIWDAWDQAHGQSLAALRAAKVFGDTMRYAHVPAVCYFTEHETTDGQGNLRKYDLPAMVRITRTCNERIADFDGFAPLTDGHTPNPDDPDQTDPPVVGYAGPYRLGMIGRLKPRWAIFADEWHYRDMAAQLERKPRRSVELWTFAHDPAHMHFDPVAVLGAEAPRLSLPSRYRAQQLHGVSVVRYSCEAGACLPGESNTFVRGGARTKTKTRYAPSGAGDTPPLPFSGEPTMPFSNEDIGQILSALQELPQFQFLDQLMQQQQQGAGAGDAAPVDDMAGEASADDFGGDDDLSDLQDLLIDEPGDDQPAPGPDGGDEPPVAAEGDEPEEKNTPAALAALGPALAGAGRAAVAAAPKALPALGRAAMHPATIAGSAGYLGARAGAKRNSLKASGQTADKYSRLKSAHNALVQEHGRLANRLQVVERERTDAERVAALQNLSSQYPDFIDLDAEFAATLYSRGASMGDKAFRSHVGQVEKYAHKAAMVSRTQASDIPRGEVSRPASATTDKYAARLAKEAVRIHTAAINAGKDGFTWEEAKAQAEATIAKRG